jgi:hypothetical protein
VARRNIPTRETNRLGIWAAAIRRRSPVGVKPSRLG